VGEEGRVTPAGADDGALQPRGALCIIALALTILFFWGPTTLRVSHDGVRLEMSIAQAQQQRQTSKDVRSEKVVVVQGGQTLFAIARAHGMLVETLISANGLQNPDRIWPGQRLVIPKGWNRRPVVGMLLWPARGYISSRFGWRWRRHHNGIDIAANWGSPIRAARGGRVSFAGSYLGYGRMVVIDHGGGMRTRYAHASSLRVKTGEMVNAGKVIGGVGCTGFCLGTHLHFEIWVNGRPVNPLPYLD
jgi:murein DD-endopeptidase MepM/ murein hydrolase activator NlpD